MKSLYSSIKSKVFLSAGPKNINLGPHAYVNPSSQIGGNLTLGDWSIIRSPIIVKGGKDVIFGKYCAVGWGVKLQTSSHDMNYANINNSFQKYMGFHSVMKKIENGIVVGNSVWIADEALILPGIIIGDGAVIAANAIVSKDVAPFSVVGGVPAKQIKLRFSESIIGELLNLKWWDWSEEKIKRNQNFFESDLTLFESIKDLIND